MNTFLHVRVKFISRAVHANDNILVIDGVQFLLLDHRSDGHSDKASSTGSDDFTYCGQCCNVFYRWCFLELESLCQKLDASLTVRLCVTVIEGCA